MIHSLAGGELKEQKVFDIAKLEFIEKKGEYFWFVSDIPNLQVGDIVLAPFGLLDEPNKAIVIKIDKNVNSQNTSIKIKNLKRIYKKI